MSSASPRSQLRKRKIVATLYVLELMEDDDQETEKTTRDFL